MCSNGNKLKKKQQKQTKHKQTPRKKKYVDKYFVYQMNAQNIYVKKISKNARYQPQLARNLSFQCRWQKCLRTIGRPLKHATTTSCPDIGYITMFGSFLLPVSPSSTYKYPPVLRIGKNCWVDSIMDFDFQGTSHISSSRMAGEVVRIAWCPYNNKKIDRLIDWLSK